MAHVDVGWYTGWPARRPHARMSSSESEAGMLKGSRITAASAGCDAISSAIRVPATKLSLSSSVVRKLQTTRGFELAIGVRSITFPRDVGLMITGPNTYP